MTGLSFGENFKNERYAYNVRGNVEYLGYNPKIGVGENDPNWQITKIGYDASDRVIHRVGPLRGRWLDRETLFDGVGN